MKTLLFILISLLFIGCHPINEGDECIYIDADDYDFECLNTYSYKWCYEGKWHYVNCNNITICSEKDKICSYRGD